MTSVLRASLATMAVVAMAVPTFAADGLLITEKTTTGTTSQEHQIQIEPNRMRAETSGPGGAQVMIFDGTAQVLRIVNPANKTYSEMTKADVDRMGAQMSQMMAQMQEQLKNLPPDQRAQVEAMMRGRGAAMGGTAPKVEYRRAGNGHVGSWDCAKYEGFLDGKKVSELCTVEPGALGVKEADVQVTRQMAEFFAAMVPGGMSRQEVFAIGDAAQNGYSGLPISRTNLGPPASTMELVGITRQSFDEAIFQVPEGYRKQALPMMPGGR
jgi:hypothetical protein